MSDTRWHHVGVTKSGPTVRFYIDGAAASAPTIGYTTLYTFDTSAAIGSRGDARGGTFWGMVDELSVYQVALSDSEIHAVYAARQDGKRRPGDSTQTQQLLDALNHLALRVMRIGGLTFTNSYVKPLTVPFELGPKAFKEGDLITIEQVTATSPRLAVGDKVTVRGRYVLKSEERARLCLYLTTGDAVGAEQDFPTQDTEITKGSGSFELAEVLRHPGHLHLSFYQSPGGKRFGTVYFGTAQQMKEISDWKLDD